ncbi:sulfite exporter TauE/SafE family protein [Jiangella muralis]|uniref:sulfite exporter TauE/SafE family protein n=1 Tax=Jiangella muralis TaxID=702383 RepID=UPI00069FE1CB|nr:sulfite exporter TauE/SafE family protein [Jiangella muralis]
MPVSLLVLLAAFGLIGGIGIAAVGPGGVLPTIGLFLLTDLSPAEVAGTAMITHVATGALATAAYTHSGHLREPRTRRTALILAGTALAGAPAGVLINSAVGTQVFGLILAALMILVAALVWRRQLGSTRQAPSNQPPPAVVAGIGLGVATTAGVVGIGGPMLSVPLLVAAGVPLLESLAAAQAQSIVIATTGTLGYLASDAIDWPLAAIVGIPELGGVLLGWKIARTLPTRHLTTTLVVSLLVLAPFIAFG